MKENNILLADSLSLLTIDAEGNIKEDTDKLNLHINWSLLMEVVAKIENLGYWVNRICGDVWIVNNEGEIIINNTTHNGGIEAVYNACVDFVKWYNAGKE